MTEVHKDFRLGNLTRFGGTDYNGVIELASSNRVRVRSSAVLSLTAALLLAGTTGANAWTWATASSPQQAYYNNVSRGAGYGEAYRSGYSTVWITTALKDSYINARGAYHDSTIWKPGDNTRSPIYSQSGRHEGPWVNMPSRSESTATSSLGMWASSRICEDAPWQPDICSTTRSSAL